MTIVALWMSMFFTLEPIPSGLWREKSEGFVLRLEACGQALCGYAAGAPPGAGKLSKACGALILRDLRWDETKRRWAGHMTPPDQEISLTASLETNGPNALTIRAKHFFLSKTLRLERFQGNVRPDCGLE